MKTSVSAGGNPRKNPGKLNPFTAAHILLKDLPLDPSTRKSVEGSIRAKDIPTLAGLGQFEDREYHDPSHVWETLVKRQIASLFKKNSEFSDDDKCTAAARSTFERGERICRITNKRLDHFYRFPGRNDPELSRWLKRMEADITRLLGDTRDFLDEIPRLVRLTSGATEDRPRRRSLPFLKVTGKICAPRSAEPMLVCLLSFFGVDSSSWKFAAVEHNTVALVPKSWKTHRTIAKEPTHSLPFQLSLDQHLKRCLKKWGIDLSSQKKNQDMAKLGSLDGSLATVDLEMASDTLSYNAVAWMLPPEWLKIFDLFRSSSFVAPWGKGDYAKYSSMGNGYTFSLETMIFGAACRAVGSRQFAVYGDDIVLETVHVPSLVRLLNFLGFRVNDEKSFYNPQSRFRESCGCDYYLGELVTPFYLRECPKLSDRAGMSHALNGLISTVPGEGELYAFVAETVRGLGLRYVPYNEDTRSGVFISPNMAWRTKKLTIDRRVKKGGRDNPDYGFPVFKGYLPIQETRNASGWRSLFLWHLQKCYKGVRTIPPTANRFSAFLLQMVGGGSASESRATVTSVVSTGGRYVHGTCRFSPNANSTPSYVYSFSDYVGSGPRPKAGKG